ncbi:MAG: hypothetical protein WDN26_16460 [Chitinophagaceae bacterium]
MLKDVDYKHKIHIFYTNEFSKPTENIDYNIIVQYMGVGHLECKEERIRSYVIVRPEYYVWHPSHKEKRMTMKVIWEGAYYINMDRRLITVKDIYECWADTAKEITDFIVRNQFGALSPPIPSLESVQNELENFLDSLQSASEDPQGIT